MANITAADVNKLRQMTGAGMMDCKSALVEAEGDFDNAVDILRKKGQKVASKRADRDAAEGCIVAKVSADSKKAVLVMVNCETDFVAINEDFVKFTTSIVDVALAGNATSIDSLKALELNGLAISERLNEMVGKIGEKIDIGAFEVVEGEKAYAYIHPGNRLVSIVAFNKADVASIDELGKDITMQIAAMSPVAISESDVPAEVLEKEKEIAMDLARNEGKAENMLEKIAMGRVSKFVKENTLLNQEFIKENKITVRQHLAKIDKDLTVVAFKRSTIQA